jgi:uncharacterized membrane protein YkvA (DUF1232 family)
MRDHQPGWPRRGAALDLSLWNDLRLALRLLRDPRVSNVVKGVVPLVAALYVLSPVDLIPDFLLGIGELDDLGVIGLAVAATVMLLERLAPAAVVDEHLAKMGRSRPTATSRGGKVIDVDYAVGSTSKQPMAARRGRRVA